MGRIAWWTSGYDLALSHSCGVPGFNPWSREIQIPQAMWRVLKKKKKKKSVH